MTGILYPSCTDGQSVSCQDLCDVNASGRRTSHVGSCGKYVKEIFKILPRDDYIRLVVDPCAGVICDYFGVCVDTGPHTFECVAPTCDSVDDPVCASNAVTYDNECEYHRFIFLTRQRHISIHHNGSCNGILRNVLYNNPDI